MTYEITVNNASELEAKFNGRGNVTGRYRAVALHAKCGIGTASYILCPTNIS